MKAYNKYQCSHKTQIQKISVQIEIGICKLACKDAHYYLYKTTAVAVVSKGTQFLLKENFIPKVITNINTAR